MRLLLDENLSRRLVPFLQDAYPGSTQVALVGLEQASDATLWAYARDHGYVLVSQDADFQDLSLARGAPPPLLWLRLGNVGKTSVLQALIARRTLIENALLNEGKTIVELLP